MTDHDIERMCAEYLVAIDCQDWMTVERICDLTKRDADLKLAITTARLDNLGRFERPEKVTQHCQDYLFAVRSEDWEAIDQIWESARFDAQLEEAFHEFHVAIVDLIDFEYKTQDAINEAIDQRVREALRGTGIPMLFMPSQMIAGLGILDSHESGVSQ